MLTLIQAKAILSILIAFGVPQPTVNQVQDILIPPIATTTVAFTPVPVIQSPVIENQPVYFGSTAPTAPTPAPVDSTPVVQPPVVQSVVMDPLVISNIEVSPGGYLRVFTSKSLATTTVSNGTLGDPLIDNYPKDADGYPLCLVESGHTVAYHGHIYEYKMSNPQKPFTATMTDADGQVVTKIVQ